MRCDAFARSPRIWTPPAGTLALPGEALADRGRTGARWSGPPTSSPSGAGSAGRGPVHRAFRRGIGRGAACVATGFELPLLLALQAIPIAGVAAVLSVPNPFVNGMTRTLTW